jgi:4-amino-4-deoxy-L-arabinose transferase-like glycosyltransferase
MSRRVGILLLGAIAVATALRVWDLGGKSLWTDEGVSWALAARGATPYEHPPLYMWLLGGLIRIGLRSEWGLRFLSVLSGIALVPLVYAVGSRLLSAAEGVVASWLTALSPCWLMASQEGRMYSLQSLAGAASLLALVGLLRSRHGGWRLLWVASAWGLVATHHVGWLLVVPELLWLFCRRDKSRRREALLLGCIVALLYVPIAPQSLGQVGARLGQPSGGFLQGGGRGVLRVAPVLFRMGAGYALPSGRAWTVLGAVPLVLLILGAVRTAKQPAVVGLLGAWLLPVVSFVAVEGSPANVAAQAAAAYSLLAAAGLCRAGRARIPLGVLLTVAWGGGIWSYYGARGYPLHPEDWRSLARHLEEHCDDGDLIYLTGSRNSYFTFDYYYRGTCKFACRVPETELYAMETRPVRGAPQVKEAVEASLRSHPAVWVVHVDWGLPAVNRDLHELDGSYLTWEAPFGRGLRLKRYAAQR